MKLWLQTTPVANLEEPGGEYKCTLLCSAARSGNLGAVKLLVERCAQVDSNLGEQHRVCGGLHNMDLTGIMIVHKSTALHAACCFGHPRVVTFLLDNLANFTLQNSLGLTALAEATLECKSEFIKHPRYTNAAAAAGGTAAGTNSEKFGAKI